MKKWISIIAFALLLFAPLFVSPAPAVNVQIEWDAPLNAEAAGLAGYKIYWGSASRTYTQHIDVHDVLTYSLTGLPETGAVYLALTDYNAKKESGYSNELVLYTIIASASPGGVISPAGSTMLTAGFSQTYTITPNEGYETVSVSVDGTAIAAPATTYTFSDVSAGHTIAVSFALAAPGPPLNARQVRSR